MAEWWSLNDLACRPPDAGRKVALRSDGGDGGNGRYLSHADLLQRIDCWQVAFAARPESHCAIYLNDPFEFSAALLAAWHAGKTAVLPGDDLPGTLQVMAEAGYLLAGDLPHALQPAAGAQPGKRRPLDPAQARMRLYTSGSQGRPEADRGLLAPVRSALAASMQEEDDRPRARLRVTAGKVDLIAVVHAVDADRALEKAGGRVRAGGGGQEKEHDEETPKRHASREPALTSCASRGRRTCGDRGAPPD